MALPLTVGVAGVALADDFQSSSSSAGPTGTVSEQIITGTNPDGSTYYLCQRTVTGPDGSHTTTVVSLGGGAVPPGPGGGSPSSYNKHTSSAGPDGSSSSDVEANAGTGVAP